MMPEKDSFHSMGIEEVLDAFQTSADGLTESVAQKRLKHYGKNVLKNGETPLSKIFFRQFKSPLIGVLFFASVLCLFLGDLSDFFIVIGLVFIDGCLGFWQEVKAQTSLASLRKLTETKNMVLRGGSIQVIPSSDLVPGDCLVLHPGELVTADVRLIETSGMMINESTLTGESAPVVKTHEITLPNDSTPFEWSNMVLSGSAIVRGTGRGIVVKTGQETYLASIGEKIKEASPQTPLQVALQTFSKKYVCLLLGLFSILGVIGVLQGRSASELLYFLVASLVSAVPEGLPIIVTVVSIMGAMLLRHKQTLVRDLPSVETLGSTTVIATDKTGTITEGKLFVRDTTNHDLTVLKQIAALCNDAGDGFGDPLDIALADWVGDIQEQREKNPRIWLHPFDPNLMLMATINEVQGTPKLFVKGAYESLRKMAANSQDRLKELDEAFVAFMKKGCRVLALGVGTEASQNQEQWSIVIEGLVACIDPPKKGVLHAVASAKHAGIHVIMITGDHPITAQTIAHEVGIWQEGDGILTGEEIENISDECLAEQLAKTSVMARILPEHKYRVVKALQASGEIVAVTGDGVNDIPALKAAHIGIAMGSGVEAAKSVSQMILVDDNFSVIVDAIKYARIISANVKKAIYYLVSSSLQEVVLLTTSILSDMSIPLTAIQILWLNLVTSGIMDKGFPFTKEESNVMAHKPIPAQNAFFDKAQIKRILFFGVLQGLFCYFLYLFLDKHLSFVATSSIMFCSVVFSQLANAIQSQKESEPFFYNIQKSFTINPIMGWLFVVSFVAQFLALHAFPSFLGVSPLTPLQWLFPIGSFGFAFFIIEGYKWIEFRGSSLKKWVGLKI
jgi:Ca2+-transporting ATPase